MRPGQSLAKSSSLSIPSPEAGERVLPARSEVHGGSVGAWCRSFGVVRRDVTQNSEVPEILEVATRHKRVKFVEEQSTKVNATLTLRTTRTTRTHGNIPQQWQDTIRVTEVQRLKSGCSDTGTHGVKKEVLCVQHRSFPQERQQTHASANLLLGTIQQPKSPNNCGSRFQ